MHTRRFMPRDAIIALRFRLVSLFRSTAAKIPFPISGQTNAPPYSLLQEGQMTPKVFVACLWVSSGSSGTRSNSKNFFFVFFDAKQGTARRLLPKRGRKKSTKVWLTM